MPDGSSMKEYQDIVQLLRSKTNKFSDIEHIVVLDDANIPLVSPQVDMGKIARTELATYETTITLNPNELNDLEGSLEKLVENEFLTKSNSGVFIVTQKLRHLLASFASE